MPEAQIEVNDKTIQINVVTLKAYLAELALGHALNEQIDDLKQLCTRTDELLATRYSDVKQFVRVTPDYIQVGINCDLIDDNAIMLAFRMVAKLPSLKPGTTIELGELVHVYENNIPCRERTG